MKFTVEVEGQERVVEVDSRDGRPVFSIDGRPLEADAAEVEPGVFSILTAGRSFEVKIEEMAGQLGVHITGRPYPYRVALRDPRRRGRASSAVAAEGRQEIASPMPGKVVQLLVAEEQAVEAGQGLIVVEAMKMQNEIRSPKAGRVVKILARPGAAVNAGETLLVVE
jgi:biotin carboxyl carrier protein